MTNTDDQKIALIQRIIENAEAEHWRLYEAIFTFDDGAWRLSESDRVLDHAPGDNAITEEGAPLARVPRG